NNAGTSASSGEGGGIYDEEGPGVSLVNSTAGTRALPHTAYKSGGGIYAYYGGANLVASHADYNQSLQGSGGGIYTYYGALSLVGTADLTGSHPSSVDHNTAKYEGGGIHAYYTGINISNSD